MLNLAPGILFAPSLIVIKMERIERFRRTQPITLDEFIEKVLDAPSCAYCENFDECKEYMGEDLSNLVGEGGCSAFDNTVTGLKEIYLKKYCISKA
jgi:sugar (pentulose or hexulose) kinase